MELGTETNKALDKWILTDTWYKSHSSDMSRFYEFLNQYVKEHGYSLEEGNLTEEVVSRANVQTNEQLKNVICRRVSLAINILDFLQQTSR